MFPTTLDPGLRTPQLDFRDAPQDNDWTYPTGQEPVADVFYPFFQDFLKMIFARRLFQGQLLIFVVGRIPRNRTSIFAHFDGAGRLSHGAS